MIPKIELLLKEPEMLRTILLVVFMLSINVLLKYSAEVEEQVLLTITISQTGNRNQNLDNKAGLPQRILLLIYI